jgi:hypothetical protein
MSFSVWSPMLGTRIIFSDAQTKNQARAAYRRYLRKMSVPRNEYKQYMTGIVIEYYNDGNHYTYIKIGE